MNMVELEAKNQQGATMEIGHREIVEKSKIGVINYPDEQVVPEVVLPPEVQVVEGVHIMAKVKGCFEPILLFFCSKIFFFQIIKQRTQSF